jgi:hypothetical protein
MIFQEKLETPTINQNVDHDQCCSFTPWITHSFTPSFIYSFIHSFIDSLTHSLMHSQTLPWYWHFLQIASSVARQKGMEDDQSLPDHWKRWVLSHWLHSQSVQPGIFPDIWFLHWPILLLLTQTLFGTVWPEPNWKDNFWKISVYSIIHW